MKDSSFTRVIYTELDSLYDTKIALLDIIDPRLAKEYLFKKIGIPNQVLYVNNTTFKYLYSFRDNRVLKASQSTAILDLIRAIVSDINISNKLGTAITSRTKLLINIYPYKLSDVEKRDIEEFYKLMVLHLDEIEIVDVADLNSIANNTSIIIKNDGLDWFFENKVRDPEFKLSHVTLIIPDVITNYEIKKIPLDVDKMKEYLSTTFIDSIKLDFIEAEAFRMKLIDIPV